MTAPDPKILAAAITRMEAEIALFPEAEFPVEHDQTRAVVAAVRASEAMREALESVRQYGADTLSGRADGGPDDRKWQRGAVLEMTRRARVGLGGQPRPAAQKMTAADLGCREQTCQQGLGDPPMDCGWPERGCGLRLLEPSPAALNPAGPA